MTTQCARVCMFSLIKGNLKFSSAITSTSKLIFFIPHIQIFKLWVWFFFGFDSVNSKNIFSPTPLFLISIPHMNQNLNNMFFVNGILFWNNPFALSCSMQKVDLILKWKTKGSSFNTIRLEQTKMPKAEEVPSRKTWQRWVQEVCCLWLPLSKATSNLVQQ